MTRRTMVGMTALIAVGLLCAMARVGEDRQAPTPTRSVLFWSDPTLSVISPDGRFRARLVSGGPLDTTLFPPGVFASPGGRKALLICPDEPRLYLLEGAGRIRPLGVAVVGAEPKAAWSPDEVWVAVRMWGSYEGTRVWVLNTLTNRRYCVPPRDPAVGAGYRADDRPIGWLSATELALMRQTGSAGAAEAPETESLRVVSIPPPVNGEPRTVAGFTTRCHAVVLLPDRQTVVLWLGTEIVTIDLSTGERRTLASGLTDDGDGHYETGLVENGHVVFTGDPGEAGAPSAWLIAADGSKATRLEWPEAEAMPLAPIPAALWKQLREGVEPFDYSPLQSHIACSAMPTEYWVPPPPAETVTQLTVSSQPSGAEVYVNGHLKGKSPCVVTLTSAQSWAQRYWLAVVKDHLDIASRELFLRQGQREEVAVILDAPFTPASMPRDLAAACNAVRKAILHRDIAGFLQHVSEPGLTLDYEVIEQRISRSALERKLRRQQGWLGMRNREAFLEGGRVRLRGNGWFANEDAYSYCWVDFGQIGKRWYVTELGSGSVNE